jgi:hypothetical protein
MSWLSGCTSAILRSVVSVHPPKTGTTFFAKSPAKSLFNPIPQKLLGTKAFLLGKEIPPPFSRVDHFW